MPLASTAALQWYGPACASMVVQAGGGVERFAPKRQINAALQVQGVGSVQAFRPYRAQYFGMSAQGGGSVERFAPKRRIRAGLVVAVNELSQDDVTGAVLEAKVEGDTTLKQALRLLLSVAVGKTDITDLGDGAATVKFRDLADSKDRIVATMSGSERAAVTKDPT
jgi:hypothetical protein